MAAGLSADLGLADLDSRLNLEPGFLDGLGGLGAW